MLFKKAILLLFLIAVMTRITATKADSNGAIEEEEYDDEEVVNIQTAPPVKPIEKKEAEKEGNKKSSERPMKVEQVAPIKPKSNAWSLQYTWKVLSSLKASDFYVELAFLFAIIAYAFTFIFGNATNLKMSKTWLKGSNKLFIDQFSLVGDTRGYFLMRNCPNEFLFYASGRVNCKYLYGKVDLYPRHDLLKMLYSLYSPHHDHVTMYYELPEEAIEGVFAVTQRSKANDLRRARFDINNFTKQTNDERLPKNLVVLSEHSDLTKSIITTQIASKLKEVGDVFESVILSDQPDLKPETLESHDHKVLAFTYKFPPTQSLDELHTLSLMFVDTIATLKNRPEVKSKLQRNREEVYHELHKEQLEKLAKEREERLQEKRKLELEQRAQLSPQQQRKLEEKEAKKEKRKQMAKMTQRMK